jgi:hypothetical protein
MVMCGMTLASVADLSRLRYGDALIFNAREE